MFCKEPLVKLGIDSYCYHRYFGEVYPGIQKRPRGKRMTVFDFLQRAKRFKVGGVSLESYFISCKRDDLMRLREKLDEYGFVRVWAWGHPDGLRAGSSRKAGKDLVANLSYAKAIGAEIMRVVGGNAQIRPDSWGIHYHRLRAALKRVLPVARDNGIILGSENHIDLTGDEEEEAVKRSLNYLRGLRIKK